MASPLTPLLLFLIFLLLSNPAVSLPTPDYQTDCLNVPNSVFSTSIKTAIVEVQKAVSVISKISHTFHNFRLFNAVNDCSDLLDLSSDELMWTQAAIESVKSNGTGDRASDLKAWLSAALGNQDTCLDGFDGTDGIVKSIVSGTLKEATAVVANVLKMVRQIPGKKRSGGSPAWIYGGIRRLLQAPASSVAVNVTVALDGSGNFKSVNDAVLAAPDYNVRRYVIYVKRGVYRENVEIKKKKWNLMLIGDGMNATIISGNRSFVDGWTTFRSATFAVSGRGFIARDMSFENTAGPEKHQAVAFRSDSDLSAYYRCGFYGYQDTLYAHSLRQFYRECRITGTVDFIFGDGAVVFQNCQILARKPLHNQKISITAQGRKDPDESTGFSIQFCNISADSDLLASPNASDTYLGRPWKPYSRTVFMQSYLDSVIEAEGWLEWEGDFALTTLYYGEYRNYGPGAGLSGRVKWPGYHMINDSAEANKFTVAQFIDGNLWLPETGVKYTSGLGV
ncbi:pectinesterase/pectinesterase inhibitor PPE8B-like [Magnolia sinica]|uniref:pectinesterase/pectinesterase inhibitor PPE8B-like n=1 Tax=Magnolia sinica TaxID=86752 RepID=UPI002658D739|nr:pectinesterase/pectinesterase inhibitor PPE8B-like [Magnolia sinica]